MYNIPFQNLCYRKSIKHINYICVSMFYRLINYRCTNHHIHVPLWSSMWIICDYSMLALVFLHFRIIPYINILCYINLYPLLFPIGVWSCILDWRPFITIILNKCWILKILILHYCLHISLLSALLNTLDLLILKKQMYSVYSP